MNEELTPAELVAEIQVRARATLETLCTPEEMARADFNQFAIGSHFGAGAAMQVLAEHGLIRDTES